ncbi:MAG: DUF3347 domain-containing protein [Deltaproteobacteria bacterium]|nr:DUF3347 domain-containing protein [Deltaproteobacteria bacterium]
MKWVRVLLLALAGMGAAAGCTSEKSQPAKAQATKAEAASEKAKAEAPSPSIEESTRQSISDALAAYERIRALLAEDSMQGLAEAAERLASITSGLPKNLPESVRPHVDAIAAAAGKLKGNASTLPDARSSFGELSRGVVALLSAEPSLAKGQHVFECGMAEGYKKWVQPSETLGNPYMGTKMQNCGTASSWE